MKLAIKLFILACLATLLLPHVSMAQNMGDGLQCPSDWHRSKRMPQRWDVNDLLKQCTPQTNDALIQLYSERASGSLVTKLDKWTQRLVRKGLPYQRLLNEQPGHVSGYPAILRFFSGYDRDGKWYDSYLVVSRYKGLDYIFIGYAMKGHDRVRIQMRNAMNAWHYPGVSGYSNTNSQQNLPGPDPVISQNTNGNVNINPTINVNRPGCTRQSNQSYTNTMSNSGNTQQNSQETNYSNSGNTYQNKPNTQSGTQPDDKPDNGPPQNNNRPSDNKYLDYMLE